MLYLDRNVADIYADSTLMSNTVCIGQRALRMMDMTM